MSKAKFDKAVAIVQSLPKDGPIQPTQDEQLFVRAPSEFSSPRALAQSAPPTVLRPPPRLPPLYLTLSFSRPGAPASHRRGTPRFSLVCSRRLT